MTQHVVIFKGQMKLLSHKFFLNIHRLLQKPLAILTIFSLGFILSLPAAAQEPGARVFTVFLNNVPHSVSETVRPCVPLMARFDHPDPHVTRVRMRYPYNHEMFKVSPISQNYPLSLHEDFMTKGEWSLSDFIAEDESGKTYGQMTLTFQPLDPDNRGLCDSFPDS